jgi:hypothetical protein
MTDFMILMLGLSSAANSVVLFCLMVSLEKLHKKFGLEDKR